MFSNVFSNSCDGKAAITPVFSVTRSFRNIYILFVLKLHTEYCYTKGIVFPKMKLLLLFIHPYVVTHPYAYIHFWGTQKCKFQRICPYFFMEKTGNIVASTFPKGQKQLHKSSPYDQGTF